MKNFFDSIEASLSAAWTRVRDATSVSDEGASLFRIVYAIYVFLIAMPTFSWVGEVPQGLYEPPPWSFAGFFHGFPPTAFFKGIDLILPVLLLAVGLGVRARIAGLLFALIAIVGSSFAYSLGKIDHDILFYMVPVCMAFSNWGVGNALVPDRTKPGFGHAILACLIAFGLFTAGLEKAYVWLDADLGTSGFMSWFVSGYYDLGRDYLLAPLVLKLDPRLFEMADYTAVVFELSGFFFLLAGRRWWLSWLTAACAFHLVNTLLLNIAFVNYAPVYGCFLIPFVMKKMSPGTWIRWVLVALALCHLVQRAVSGGAEVFYIENLKTSFEVALYAGLVIWSLMSLFPAVSLVSRWKSIYLPHA